VYQLDISLHRPSGSGKPVCTIRAAIDCKEWTVSEVDEVLDLLPFESFANVQLDRLFWPIGAALILPEIYQTLRDREVAEITV
jgi:hypothetical protein